MLKIIKNYLVDGNLPSGDETTCEVDDSLADLFSGKYLDDSGYGEFRAVLN